MSPLSMPNASVQTIFGGSKPINVLQTMGHLDGNPTKFAVQSSYPNRFTVRRLPVYSVLDFNLERRAADRN